MKYSIPSSIIFDFFEFFLSFKRVVSLGQKPVKSGIFIRNLPLFFAKMTQGRSLPAIASPHLRVCTDELMKQNPKNPKMRVAFFSGCNIDFVFPNTGKSVFKVLQNLGVEVIYPQKQNCCGKPIIGSGDLETARKIAKENDAYFEEEENSLLACMQKGEKHG